MLSLLVLCHSTFCTRGFCSDHLSILLSDCVTFGLLQGVLKSGIVISSINDSMLHMMNHIKLFSVMADDSP